MDFWWIYYDITQSIVIYFDGFWWIHYDIITQSIVIYFDGIWWIHYDIITQSIVIYFDGIWWIYYDITQSIVIYFDGFLMDLLHVKTINRFSPHRQALDLAKAPETPEAPAATEPEPKRSSMLSFRSPLHRARSGLTAFNLDKRWQEHPSDLRIL